MTHVAETENMAIFCDFENVALGVRDADYSQFDISNVVERLLLKGNIVVKKAYSDWAHYEVGAQGILDLILDEKSGDFIVKGSNAP